MVSIDTYVAKKNWKKEKGVPGEVRFLKAIEFVAMDDGKISLLTDEEGNDMIYLTPDAARYVADQLVGLADYVEGKLKV